MKSIDSHSESNAGLVKSCVSESDKVIEQYTTAKKNLDGTMKKDDLTILQEYSRRERDTVKLIETNRDKAEKNDPEGLR